MLTLVGVLGGEISKSSSVILGVVVERKAGSRGVGRDGARE